MLAGYELHTAGQASSATQVSRATQASSAVYRSTGLRVSPLEVTVFSRALVK